MVHPFANQINIDMLLAQACPVYLVYVSFADSGEQATRKKWTSKYSIHTLSGESSGTGMLQTRIKPANRLSVSSTTKIESFSLALSTLDNKS